MYNSLFYSPTLTKKKKPNIVAFINSLVSVNIYADTEESVTISCIHSIQQTDVYTFEKSGGGWVEDFDCVNLYSKLWASGYEYKSPVHLLYLTFYSIIILHKYM